MAHIADQLIRPMIILFHLFIITTINADFLNELSKDGLNILAKSAISDVTVRKCSCTEQDQCVEELRGVTQQCADDCWSQDALMVTNKPDDLRECFEVQKPIAERFLKCIRTNIQSCVETMDGPQIPKQDIEKIIELTQAKIESSKSKIMSNPALRQLRNIINAALDFGKCVKNCVFNKTDIESCFERLKCQPHIQVNRTKKAFRKCIKQVDWKTAAGELCYCSLNAGVGNLKSFCPMLGLLSKQYGNHTSS